MRFFMRICVVLLSCLLTSGCRNSQPAAAPNVIALQTSELPNDPLDKKWEAAPEYRAQLIAQDLVEPRLLTPSTPELRIRSLMNTKELALLLEWNDPTRDDLPGAARFFDACAVQTPVLNEANVPAPQMGEKGRAVRIVYWNASWQASADGRGDTINDIYPNARVDHYPFQAASLEPASAPQHEMEKRYSPARALGNPVSGPRKEAVQDLIAEGPGTLSAAPQQSSHGRGTRTANGWAVLLRRELPPGLLEGGNVTQIAFAVWEGSKDEAGARKMRSGWTALTKR